MADDVPAAAGLTEVAFGGGRREDRLRRYLALEPRGWFVVEDGGGLLGIGGVVRYDGFAWLGLMAIRPDRQRRGLGRALAEEAIGWARAGGCSTICLVATPAGLPLYQRLGFVPDGLSHELAGTPRLHPRAPGSVPCSVTLWTPADTEDVARFDAPAFGSDRRRVLAAYAAEFPTSAWVARDRSGDVRGFIVVQGSSFGPWTAADDASASQLLDVALDGLGGALKAGVVDGTAEPLLLARGFTRTRDLPRLRLGPPVPTAPGPRLLAHASYAVG